MNCAERAVVEALKHSWCYIFVRASQRHRVFGCTVVWRTEVFSRIVHRDYLLGFCFVPPGLDLSQPHLEARTLTSKRIGGIRFHKAIAGRDMRILVRLLKHEQSLKEVPTKALYSQGMERVMTPLAVHHHQADAQC